MKKIIFTFLDGTKESHEISDQDKFNMTCVLDDDKEDFLKAIGKYSEMIMVRNKEKGIKKFIRIKDLKSIEFVEESNEC